MTGPSADFGIIVRKPGGPEALERSELPTPEPGAGEVRIVQHAIGVNFIDTYYRKGTYPWPTTPLIPGGEAAGTVEVVGEGADFKVGDRVAYTLPNGAYRTRRVVPADRLVKLPDSMAFDVAASLMLKGLTTQFLLNSCYAVKASDVVLVHAAAGGVGSLMGQWLKSLRCTSIGTVGSPDKIPIAKHSGYTHVIDYRADDFAARVKDITAGKGCDVVYDSVANDTWRGSLKSLHTRGLFVCFGQSSGPITDFKFSDLAAGGSLYATRPTLFDYIKTRAELQMRAANLFAKVASGEVRPSIGQRYPLRDAAQAHRDLESRRTTGSTILLPSP
jgi:NADPH2:quinone reductase